MALEQTKTYTVEDFERFLALPGFTLPVQEIFAE